eukprot:6075681-Prorocentrum_lima.AAC.1
METGSEGAARTSTRPRVMLPQAPPETEVAAVPLSRWPTGADARIQASGADMSDSMAPTKRVENKYWHLEELLDAAHEWGQAAPATMHAAMESTDATGQN